MTAALLLAAAPARAADVDVGVSIGISQPGVYGRIDIGRFPQPQVIVAQPIYIERPVRVVRPPEPVYLWVPPGHRKNWKKHCREYGACGVPVYFVRHDWYDREVRDRDRDGSRDAYRDGDRDGSRSGERRGRDDDDDRKGRDHPGKGNGKGNGNGKGRD
ncbi:hypothetical protein D621_05540 [beta proteobacterium AAP51]|nr:hypothetical protein D621_05540 [beta proteobacterium AAP51]